MKVLFAGSPNPSANILRVLNASSLDVVGVISQPDKRSKRNKPVEPSKVSAAAIELNLNLYRPLNIDEDFKKIISKIKFDFLLVAAYGKILPLWLLELPHVASVNIHFSLLPKYRGASPVQTAILNGDINSGVTVMKMTEGMDEGPIYSKYSIPIEVNDNKKTLEEKLTKKSIDIIESDLKNIFNKKLIPKEQDQKQAQYCNKITKLSGRVDFTKETSESIIKKFNAFYGWPGIFFERNNIAIKIHGIEPLDKFSNIKFSKDIKLLPSGLAFKTKDKPIVITRLQFPGKQIISSKDAINSYAEFFK